MNWPNAAAVFDILVDDSLQLFFFSIIKHNSEDKQLLKQAAHFCDVELDIFVPFDSKARLAVGLSHPSDWLEHPRGHPHERCPGHRQKLTAEALLDSPASSLGLPLVARCRSATVCPASWCMRIRFIKGTIKRRLLVNSVWRVGESSIMQPGD